MALDIVARVTLLPVLLGQGALVRRRALRMPEPPGLREGVVGQGPDLRVLFVGDSSAAGVGASVQAQALSGQVTELLSQKFRVDWLLKAQTGAMTRDALDWLDDLPARPFDVAVISLGVNDVTGLVPSGRWARQQERLVDKLTDKFGVRQVLASGLPPMERFPLLPQPLRWVLAAQARRLDNRLAILADTHPNISHVSVDYPMDPRYMAEDGYHPSPLAYTLWAKALVGQISAKW